MDIQLIIVSYLHTSHGFHAGLKSGPKLVIKNSSSLTLIIWY